MEVDFSSEKLTWLIFGIILFIVVLILGFIILFRIFRKRLIEQFRLANQKEVRYKNKLIEAQIISKDKERKRIASEVHDEIGSRLAILKMLINSSISSSNIELKQFKSLTENIESIIKSSQNISHGLMPPELEHAGIVPAVKGLIESINESNSKLKITFRNNNLPDRRSTNIEISIYRIIFELLHNTIKYSDASSVDLILNYNQEQLDLQYSDDGVGFDSTSILNNGLGIKNIRSRCLYIGAKYDFQTEINKGFRFTCRVKF